MRHRIFIAINFPEEIKRKLKGSQSQWPELPIRWTKPENLHITLVFLGYLSDEDLLEVCNITKEVAKRNKSFLINLKKICYGPPKKMPPRMVWVEGEKSQELGILRDDLEQSLLENVHFHKEKRAFSPHITLGRIRRWEWKKIEPEERPEVNEELNLTFEVNSIEIMESKLKRGGAEYTVLESAPLKL
jgi:2'-5' RNA ligase